MEKLVQLLENSGVKEFLLASTYLQENRINLAKSIILNNKNSICDTALKQEVEKYFSINT